MYWQTWWFRTFLIIFGIFLLITFYRLRFQQVTRELNVRFEERLAERTRISHELHDSLLQGIVSVSMQLNVALEQLPANSPARPQFDSLLGKIEAVIEEGRNTVQGLRQTKDEEPIDLRSHFDLIRQDLDGTEKTDFSIVETGSPHKLCRAVADEIFSIGREALINSFHHSHAEKISVTINYGTDAFVLAINDTGCGIAPELLKNGRVGHWGIKGMKERAEKIGANLQILSETDHGTEVILSVPGKIAYGNHTTNRALVWLKNLSPSKSKNIDQERYK